MEIELRELIVGEKEIKYFYKPAERENSPILFIFHGHGFNESPSAFNSPNWNVVCPIDNFGVDSMGSWFLGEKGDFFWLEAMSKILKYARDRSGNGRLYMWGSSMGGYASILYGYKFNARAAYANIPQTVLLGSNYSQRGAEKFFKGVITDEGNIYNDLRNIIKIRSSCKFFLCFNQLEGGDYFEEQGLRFISHLNSFKQPMYVEVRPLSSHGKNHGVSEVISLFKKYA